MSVSCRYTNVSSFTWVDYFSLCTCTSADQEDEVNPSGVLISDAFGHVVERLSRRWTSCRSSCRAGPRYISVFVHGHFDIHPINKVSSLQDKDFIIPVWVLLERGFDGDGSQEWPMMCFLPGLPWWRADFKSCPGFLGSQDISITVHKFPGQERETQHLSTCILCSIPCHFPFCILFARHSSIFFFRVGFTASLTIP